MMKKTLFIIFFVLLVAVTNNEAKRSMSRSRSSGSGSSRSSGRKTAPQPVPTSITHSQPSAPKPSLFGWQEKPAQKTQSKPNNQGHSYPSSNTGLSGNNPPKSLPNQETMQRSNIPLQQTSSNNMQSHHGYPSSNTGLSGSNQPKSSLPHQESMQRSNVPQQQAANNMQNSNSGHSYPLSNGLSGNSGSGGGYPQGTGLSGSNAAPPPYQSVNSPNNFRSPVNSPNTYNTNYQHHGPPPSYSSSGNSYNYHPQGRPPPYTNYGYNSGGQGGAYSPQSPGYFGNYVNSGRGFGSVSRTGNALTGVGIAGAGIGTVLTGLALWNLARSTGRHQHTVIYDNRGQPIAVAPENSTAPVEDSILSDLINCTLTIDNGNVTEILAIPCSIATSFRPEADVRDVSMSNNKEDNTKCTVTVVTKASKELMTTIPCSVLLNSAAENNVTEPPLLLNNGTSTDDMDIVHDDKLNSEQPKALKLSNADEDVNNYETNTNCTHESGDIRDPINPCYSVKHNLTVIPLQTTENN